MESLLIFEWLFSVFSGDATLVAGVPGGFQETPQEGTLTPWGIVESVGQNQDLRADQGAQLIWARPTILITLYDRYQNYSRIRPMAKRINQLINGQSPDVPSGVIFSCVRDFGTNSVQGIGPSEVRALQQQYSFEAKED